MSEFVSEILSTVSSAMSTSATTSTTSSVVGAKVCKGKASSLPIPNPFTQEAYAKAYSPLIENRGEALRKHHMLLKKISQKNKEVSNVNCSEEKKRTPLQEKMLKRISEEKKEFDTRNKEPLKMNSEAKTKVSSLEI